MVAQVMKSDRSYHHDAKEPCSHPYLASTVLDICCRYAVKRIVDIGCGNGFLSRTLLEAGYSVVGMEPSDSGISICRQSIQDGTSHQLGVRYHPDDFEETRQDFTVKWAGTVIDPVCGT